MVTFRYMVGKTYQYSSFYQLKQGDRMSPVGPLTRSPSAEAGLVDALAQSAFVTMGALTKMAAESDLSLTQLRVLAILRDRRLRMTDLVDYLGLEKSTLTGLVSRAEARGFLHRTPNGTDKRVVDVYLTDEGLRLAEQLAVDLTTRLRPMVALLSGEEQQQLGDLITKILRQD